MRSVSSVHFECEDSVVQRLEEANFSRSVVRYHLDAGIVSIPIYSVKSPLKLVPSSAECG